MGEFVEQLLLIVYRIQAVPLWILAVTVANLGALLVVRRRVDRIFERGSLLRPRACSTGGEAAVEVARLTELDGVEISRAEGPFSDYFDRNGWVVRLSPTVFDASTLTSLCIAVSEVGYALQEHRRDAPLPLGMRDAVMITHRLGRTTCAWVLLISLMLDLHTTLCMTLLVFAGVSWLPVTTYRIDIDARRRARRALAMAALIDSAQLGLADRIFEARILSRIAETLPRLRAPRWRRMSFESGILHPDEPPRSVASG